MPDESSPGRECLVHADAAYAFALSLTGSPESAGDVCQEAFLRVLQEAPAVRGEEAKMQLMRSVFLRASAARRGEWRRAERERAAAALSDRRSPAPEDAALARETAERVRLAVAALDESVRLPIFLHYMQGLSCAEAGKVLDLTEKAARRRVERGLEELRSSFTRAGLALAPAALVAGLRAAGTVSVKAPPGLVSALADVAAKFKTAPAAAAAGAAKGGLIMKLGLGIAAAGLVAGAAVWAVSGRSEETAKPPEPKAPSAVEGPPKSKFAIPVWHPDARWKTGYERCVGSGARGFLGGKAGEAMWYGDGLGAGRCSYGSGAGPYGCTSYDPATGRFHLVAGASRGLLDGPFSRARFGGSDYSRRPRGAGSPDGRYVYISEPFFNQTLRRMDLVSQEIKTVPVPPKTDIGGMCVDSQGRLIVLIAWTDRLAFINGEGKIEKEVKLDMQEKVGGGTFPCCLTLEEKNNRVYGSGYGAKKWYVWYWDLKDGSFHGVLPIAQAGEPKRKRNEAGPFKGTDLYGEGGTWFGPPDDPEKNFLYISPNDTMTFFRLDLAKQEIWACTAEKDGIRFIGSGEPRGMSTGKESWGTYMDGQGDILTSIPFWNGPQLVRFPRVK